MKFVVILCLALVLALVNGGRFDRCKYWFEDISRHPIFTNPNANQDFLKQHREGLIGMYQALWNDRCRTEIDILVKANRDSAGDIFFANTGLQRSFNTMRQDWAYQEEPRGYFIAIWMSYVNEFRKAVVSAYKHSKNQICKKLIGELAKLHSTPVSLGQAFEVGWRTFDTFDYCESNKDHLLI
eukprot:TRINITY_DN940_c0_g1_i12.p1 TRINITY_DN940_c0_g1~~TRINITY_DN940_c0_g1_i12.p1  ORF type:complete len:183 (+),score=29.52 TRINITY_DN940_c0_g1_i12:166-714(+)